MMKRMLLVFFGILFFVIVGFEKVFSMSAVRIIIVPPVIQNGNLYEYDRKIGKLVYRGINNGIIKSNANSSNFFYSVVRKVTPSKKSENMIISFYRKYQGEREKFLFKIGNKYRVRYIIFGFVTRRSGRFDIRINVFDCLRHTIRQLQFSPKNDQELLKDIEKAIYSLVEK